MTVTRVVTGVLRTPDGTHFANKTLVWFRANRKPAAQGGVVIVDDPFPVQTNTNGAITASIVPGLYLVQVRLKDADRLFQVAVPEGTDSFDIAEGVDTAAPPITPIELAETRAARDVAVESAQAAARWAANPVDVPVEPGQFSARHHAATASVDRVLSETARVITEAARGEAQSARDAAFANAGVFADLAAGRAAVADGGQFMVAAPDEIIRYRRDTASTQTEVARYPTLGRIDNALIDPFPENRFGVNSALRPDDYVAPTSGVTLGLGQVSIAPTGRLFVRTALATVGAYVGATLRVVFRRISGAGQPTALRFLNASNALVLSVPFAPRGGWWVAEEIVPAGTTQINVDYTNATGAAVVLTPLRAAVEVSPRETIAPDRARITGLLTDPGAIADLWPGVATVATTAGSGTPVINADGTVTVPAGANVEVRPADGLIVRAFTDVVTVLVQLTSPLVRNVTIKPIGAISGAASFPARHIGDGWWLWTGALAVAGQAAIKNIFLVIDNRAQSLGIYTPGTVVVQKVIIVDGAEIPARLPAPAADTFPDDELVLTQSAGAIQIAQRAGEPARYIRWSLTRYDDPATRALGWRLTSLTTASRAGETSFSTGIALTDSGEFEVAIREVGKSDFMGGSTHGDMQETRPLILLVDGQRVTPDGSTALRARRIEAIQKAQLWEVDNAANVLAADLVTRWVWERGEMQLAHHLTWRRNMTLQAAYLTMLPILRSVSTEGYAAPDYAPVNIGVAAHGFPNSNTARLITTGGGIRSEIEVIRGTEFIAGAFIDAIAVPARNKVYFSVVPVGGATAVTVGNVIDWEAIYRIGVT